jgi:hypothetical protein
MLEELVLEVEARLLDLGRSLWPADRLARDEAEGERLAAALGDCQQALRRACTDRAAAQRRLRANRELLRHLPSVIRRCLQRGQHPDAWQHALALDRARQETVEDEAALPRLGQLSWSLQFRSRQLQRRLGRLREQRLTT